MAFVRVEQRNAHLASSVRLEHVNGRDGQVARGTVTVISNTRRGSGEDRAEEATAIQWTLWGKQAENAAEYLGKGSHVNIVGCATTTTRRTADCSTRWRRVTSGRWGRTSSRAATTIMRQCLGSSASWGASRST